MTAIIILLACILALLAFLFHLMNQLLFAHLHLGQLHIRLI